MLVNSDQANDKVTQRSRTGFCIFIIMACEMWHMKRQATVECAVFGVEFVALKQGTEASRALQYKLHMMGIPIVRPTYTYGDNMSTIHNMQCPDSTLKRKSNSICNHAVLEAVAMQEILTRHVKFNENPVDLLTQVVSGGIKRQNLIRMYLYDIADNE